MCIEARGNNGGRPFTGRTETGKKRDDLIGAADTDRESVLIDG